MRRPGRCVICQMPVNEEVRQAHKLADFNKPGRRGKPAWMYLMAMRRQWHGKTDRQ
jgi:hypothetical protein